MHENGQSIKHLNTLLAFCGALESIETCLRYWNSLLHLFSSRIPLLCTYVSNVTHNCSVFQLAFVWLYFEFIGNLSIMKCFDALKSYASAKRWVTGRIHSSYFHIPCFQLWPTNHIYARTKHTHIPNECGIPLGHTFNARCNGFCTVLHNIITFVANCKWCTTFLSVDMNFCSFDSRLSGSTFRQWVRARVRVSGIAYIYWE